MKHKYLKKIIASSVIISSLLTLIPIKASAAWTENGSGSWSYTEGYWLATGWRQIDGTWYFFDQLGQMKTGWIYDNGSWYYMDLSGAMQIGVIQIEGKIHLFSQNGAMQIGSTVINGKLYNFDNNGACIDKDAPMPIKGFDYYGSSTIPYIPNQIIDENANMSSDIPSDGKPQVKEYTVKFKDDDGDLLKSKRIKENEKVTLYKPSKSGYDFIEWNTKDDGDGTGYDYDEKITIKKDLTLYAQWEESDVDTTDPSIIKVTRIDVSGSGNLAKIDSLGGSLQMTKKVTPSDASDQTVKWSVINGTSNSADPIGEAIISSSGRLTAVSNGKVTVKATAADGSGVVGVVIVTISGQ